MTAAAKIRPSPIAGIWYPADAAKLAGQIDGFLLGAAEAEKLEGEPVAVIAPHAGYRYSGRTAGYAFHSVMGRSYDLVVVVSPLHGYHPAEVVTTSHRAYATPLGTIEVDQDALQVLMSSYEEATGLDIDALANDGEHSLEIELPFLQRALTATFKLLPLMVRSHFTACVDGVGQKPGRCGERA